MTVYLFSTTEVSQLLKTGLLIEHYSEHKSLMPSMSLWDFLKLHYNNHLENHPHDEDYEKDKNLPFIAPTNVLNFCFTPLQSTYFEIKAKCTTSGSPRQLPPNDNFTGSEYPASIWQPPRSC